MGLNGDHPGPGLAVFAQHGSTRRRARVLIPVSRCLDLPERHVSTVGHAHGRGNGISGCTRYAAFSTRYATGSALPGTMPSPRKPRLSPMPNGLARSSPAPRAGIPGPDRVSGRRALTSIPLGRFRARMTVMESYVERSPVPGLARVVRTVWIQRTGEASYVQRHLPTGG